MNGTRLGVCGVAAWALLLAASVSTAGAAAPRAAASGWTGCYAGVNGGYGWNSGSSRYQDDPNTTGDPINHLPDGFGPGNLVYLGTPAGTAGSGWLGGGGGGCNWQSGTWVIGIEGDISAGHVAGSDTASVVATGTQQFAVGPNHYTSLTMPASANEQVSLRWLGTLRARAGIITLADRLLVYATGGLAVGGVRSQGSLTAGRADDFLVTWSGSNATTKAGFVVGGGAEWAFSDRWTAKAEYLWYDLGTAGHPLDCAYTNFPPSCSQAYPTLGNARSSVFGSILRMGLNYHFGGH